MKHNSFLGRVKIQLNPAGFTGVMIFLVMRTMNYDPMHAAGIGMHFLEEGHVFIDHGQPTLPGTLVFIWTGHYLSHELSSFIFCSSELQ
jgi:hypothetical protein